MASCKSRINSSTRSVQADGTVSDEISVVKDTWLTPFKTLLNPDTIDNNIREVDLPVFPNTMNGTDALNVNIMFEEIAQALRAAHKGKALGIDLLPVEVFKNQTCVHFIFHLFSACFKTNCVPEVRWKGTITPTKMDSSKDSLCCVLNNGHLKFVESNGYVIDEQNVCQKGKSTIDHFSNLTGLLELKKLQKKDTYVA